MSLVINTNVASLNGQRNLAATQAQQAQTFQRLSTGLRVNSAKDDAGGLYLAQAQTKDIRGLGMATRNAGDGISMAQTAEGALDQIGKNLQRINELAIQSANGTYSAEARGGLQKEVDQLTQEINRIVETTEFNGKKLLNSAAVSETLQIGFENNAGSRITTGLEGGIQGVINEQTDRQYQIAGSDKTFTLASSDIDGNTTSQAAVVAEANQVLADKFGIQFDGASNGFTIGASLAADLESAFNAAKTSADADSQARLDATATTGGSLTGVGAGAAFSNDVTLNGITYKFEVAAERTAGGTNTFSSASFTAEYANGDTVTIGGTFAADGTNTATEIAAFTIGGADEAIEELTEARIYGTNALENILGGNLTSVETVDITTQESAQLAITQSRNAIDMVSELRATFGANMNRFESVISGNQIYSENLQAARSRIQDADFAVETANLAKQQVLQQAGIAALGQANASSQAVLGLL